MQLAADDFGTGYSSLSYLPKFPIDAWKIDQSFNRQITTAPDETTIVPVVISMGRSMKLRVVEGVETQELAFLQARQCDRAAVAGASRVDASNLRVRVWQAAALNG
jgi:sensor c-di-GMP phosphodiesterase-like protein